MKMPMYEDGRDGRRVGFAHEPLYSRRPRSDEEYVMEHFHTHAKKCADCANPYSTHISGRKLCDKGHLLAQDVAQYIYSQGGRPYSMLDRESLKQRVQIEIPPHCDKVRQLLRAIDEGLRVRSPSPKISSLDKDYYVPTRPKRQSYVEDRGRPVRIRDSKRPRDEDYRDYEDRRYRSDPKYRYGDRYSYTSKRPAGLPTNHSPYGKLWESDDRDRKRRQSSYYAGNPFYYYKPSKGGAERRIPRSESPKRESFRVVPTADDYYASRYTSPSRRRYTRYEYPIDYRSSRYRSPDSYRSSGYSSGDSYSSSRRSSSDRIWPRRLSWSPERLYRGFFR